jgi:hypothetical protein
MLDVKHIVFYKYTIYALRGACLARVRAIAGGSSSDLAQASSAELCI